MKVYKAGLLEKEFFFLKELVKKHFNDENFLTEWIDEIKIRRADNKLMFAKGHEDSYSWCDGGYYNYTYYYAIANGDIFKFRSEGRSSSGSGNYEEWNAESIADQLLENKLIPQFIVECVRNDRDANGNGQLTFFWTIYKMDNFGQLDHMLSEVDIAASVLKTEIRAMFAK